MTVELTLRPGESEALLRKRAAKKLGIAERDIEDIRILRRSIDARKKPQIAINYRVTVTKRGEKLEIPAYYEPIKTSAGGIKRPVVVGFGPAGMFAAMVLARAGLRPIVLERGADVDTRVRKVEEFWSGGSLDTSTNVQFGEGGAGTFSDGKLTTGTRDERISYVLRTLVDFGADERILYDAKPHIGTDRLRQIVKNLREEVKNLGGEVRFMSEMTGLEQHENRVSAVIVNGSERIACDAVILAVGHSARDTAEYLYSVGVQMEPKAFSMGVRIEHLQRDIDHAQYGYLPERNELPPADYKLSVSFPEGDSAYTFCMCPGGYVVAAASEEGRICTNGMSYSGRNGQNANSALLVTLRPEDFPYGGALGGMRWQREVESAAYNASGSYLAPAQRVEDFLAGRPTLAAGAVAPTYRPGVHWCDLNEILPENIAATLKKAIPALGRKLRGFDSPDAILTAVEARSSSPVRLTRNADLESNFGGLYPCGEGAGYAGGIVSAAVDGVRVAEKVISKP